MPHRKPNEPVMVLPPHPAMVSQPKRPFGGGIVERPPHPAKLVQGRAVPARGRMEAQRPLPPHPATIVQPQMALPRPPALPPHPATVGSPRSSRSTAPARGGVSQRMEDDGQRGRWRYIFLEFLLPHALSLMGFKNRGYIESLIEDYARDWDKVAEEQPNASGVVLLKGTTEMLAEIYAKQDGVLADALLASLGQALAQGSYPNALEIAQFWLDLRRKLAPKEGTDRKGREVREYDVLLDLLPVTEDSTQLFLGEGDFTFTQFLGQLGLGESIVSSTIEKERDVKKYKKAKEALKLLDELGARVRFEVDAKKIEKTLDTGLDGLTRIVFNFPFVPTEQRGSTKPTKEMLIRMVESASGVLKKGGELHLTIVDSDWWEERLVSPLANSLSKNGFELVDVTVFNEEDFLGYEHRKSHEDKSAKSTKGSKGKTFIYRKR